MHWVRLPSGQFVNLDLFVDIDVAAEVAAVATTADDGIWRFACGADAVALQKYLLGGHAADLQTPENAEVARSEIAARETTRKERLANEERIRRAPFESSVQVNP